MGEIVRRGVLCVKTGDMAWVTKTPEQQFESHMTQRIREEASLLARDDPRLGSESRRRNTNPDDAASLDHIQSQSFCFSQHII